MDGAEKINLIKKIIDPLYNRLASCDICPRSCHVNRLNNETGYCGTGKEIVIYSAFLHYGEEPAVSGKDGSGTIFFSGCNLKCVYCQNYKFSHAPEGKKISEDDLAKIMVGLQNKGAHNINLVTPTHFLPQILKAIFIALEKGLKIPLVYNTSGYEKKEIIAKLKEIIDIYLTDIKYFLPQTAKKYSNAADYPQFCQESTKEMYNQTKESLWEDDILQKGIIIRHLVLPNYIKESKNIFLWIKESAPNSLVSTMFQYQPYFKAKHYPNINRSISRKEYSQIKALTEKIGLNGWIQDYTPLESLAGPYFKPNIEV
ncbi:MAG: radical SAM protein [Candidatus Omnitrophica bacterium]|jgi:putative pyruvate formate lyase activating enzyme|nr:radical SAM protein [Candidatus Omnitrophota bacterium]